MKKRRITLFTISLLVVFALCSCNKSSNSLCNRDQITVHSKITSFIKQTNKENEEEGEDRYFFLFSFVGEKTERIVDNGTCVHYEGEIKTLKRFDANETTEEFTHLKIVMNPRNICYEEDYSNSKPQAIVNYNESFSLFRSLMLKYNTYLAYVKFRGTNYHGNAYTNEDGLKVSFEYPYFEVECFRVIPVIDNKISINSLYSFFDNYIDSFETLDSSKKSERKDEMRPWGIDYLFEEGDDVYETFPSKLKYYNKYYSQLFPVVHCD